MTQTVDVGTRPIREIAERSGPAYQAFMILRVAFTIAPIIAGLDKFFHLLVNWDQYLTPLVPQLTGISAHSFMLAVGVIEIIAGIIVAVKPRVGSIIVAVWLGGIILNLLLVPGFYDIALRDLGLCLAAIALFRLTAIYDRFGRP
ncbi:MAG TPA: hypothetical protein V6D22_13380 [Candidatus Obscuribacterales bacterium]